MNTIYKSLKLDRNIPVPLYYQLKQFMIDQIEQGRLQEGDPVPPEEELCELLSISRATIRQAFSELVKEGHLKRQKAKGTFIARPKIQGDFFQTIESFNGEMRAKGLAPTTKVLECKVVRNESMADRLKLPPTTPIISLKRLRFADDEPMVYVDTFLSFEKYGSLMGEDLEKESLYELLHQRFGDLVYRVTRILRVELADRETAEMLGIKKGDPIYTVFTASFTRSDAPVAYSVSKYRGDLNEFRVDLYKN
ncbi:MAG: GntR family transcriptional regulator [Christensenellaceae bacterium]|nr:GntR family transcriptional regulator [Christensenellaceae bacterium]